MQSQPVARPFLKWAGGKNQLLPVIRPFYPRGDAKVFVEPFVGAGAVFFDARAQGNFKRYIINDFNPALINVYLAVRDDVSALISELTDLQQAYLPLDDESRAVFYYERRGEFNGEILTDSVINVRKAALFIFLNKTCFNGLYRVNRGGAFNVPHGRYTAPLICDSGNLLAASQALQGVDIRCGSYEALRGDIGHDTWVYLDPPYRPISATASFNAYAGAFGDDAQVALSEFVADIAVAGAQFVLSNSDPKNSDDSDVFFDVLYSQFTIHRVSASRAISSAGAKRGKISEILVTNISQHEELGR